MNHISKLKDLLTESELAALNDIYKLAILNNYIAKFLANPGIPERILLKREVIVKERRKMSKEESWKVEGCEMKQKDLIGYYEIAAIPIDLDKTYLPNQDTLFGGRFGDIMVDASDEWIRHYPDKGDSWAGMPLDELKIILFNCYHMFSDHLWEGEQYKQYDDLIDLLNMCLMVLSRMKKDNNQNHSQKSVKNQVISDNVKGS